MTQKRMFSNSVVGSDSFLEMPDSAQNLYFHFQKKKEGDSKWIIWLFWELYY